MEKKSITLLALAVQVGQTMAMGFALGKGLPHLWQKQE
jgi:hypothetical protein